MRIAIDNLDGRGGVDYSSAVAVEGPITIQRTLNVPSHCTAEIVLGLDGLGVPVRRARVVVTAEDSTVLFTGYLATEPVRTYAGMSTEGAVYRARLSAVSDEWLLDKLGSGATQSNGLVLSLTGNDLLTRLTARVQGGELAVSGSGATQPAGAFAVKDSVPWSVNAGEAARAVYAAYRAVGGTVDVQPAGAVAHALSDADGTLSVSEFSAANLRALANDVTVSGEEEPQAYVTECFLGDGNTAVFELSEAVFRGTNGNLLSDSFTAASFDTTQWVVADPAHALSITSAGLRMNGGTGADGATMLTALDAVEMGGSVVAELGNVSLGAGASGVLAGFYSGALVLSSCVAGFRVRQQAVNGANVTVLVPVVNGAEAGTVFTPQSGHVYTLRLRLHCVEMHRLRQRYYAMVDGVVEGFGAGAAVAAPLDVVFEVVDQGESSSTPATVLYDTAASAGTMASSPATCVFAAVNALEMYGAVGSVSVSRPGSLWVHSVASSGTQWTRLVGVAGQGADCEATYGSATGAMGKVTFFSGRVPAASERVAVTYRMQGRSVARLQDGASVAAEASNSVAGTSRWLGKVVQPMARSSADCESAAQAVLAFATSRTAALAGSYAMVNPAADVWPGDVLQVTSAGVTTPLLVRSVVVKDGASVPEVRSYEIRFANDWAAEWADGMGLKLSDAIAADAVLPSTASEGAPAVLANLQQMSVTNLTATEIDLDAGLDPPSGGGFEVRRRDDAFGAGLDGADLVLRSPVRNFSITRAAQVERYYVRMYDASTPPVYSRWSSAVFVNAPVN